MTNARSMKLFAILGLTAVLILLTLFVRPARAAGITVNSAADTIANDGSCTLREAIIAANSDTPSGAALGECEAGSGADTITFAANYTITLAGTQLPSVTDTLTISGNGMTNTVIQANAAPNTATHRVLHVALTGNLTLDGVTIRHGVCRGACATPATQGGGIYNDRGILTISNSAVVLNDAEYGGGFMSSSGAVTLTDSEVSSNTADDGAGIYQASPGKSMTLTRTTMANNVTTGSGGAIHNSGGTLNVFDSYLHNNRSTDGGAGIYIHSSSSLNVSGSTFAINSTTGLGGGAIATQVTTQIVNSTFSTNSTGANGAAIATIGSVTMTLTNSTFNGNSTTSGGAIAQLSPTLTLTANNNILVAGFTGTNCNNIPALNSTNISTDTSCGSATQLTAGAVNLGGLASNGGPTPTHALLAGSAAIDFILSTSCSGTPVNGLDQRGEPRNVDIPGTGNDGGSNLCDAGAFEAQLPASGTITIVKVANPAADTVFSFTDDIEAPNSFTLQDPSDDTQVFSDVPTGGSHTITEDDSPGWPLTNIQCNAAGASTTDIDLAGGFAVVTDLVEDDTVTCTFTNTQCQPGYFDGGGNTCEPAPAGSFVDMAGATSATECPAGRWQDQQGQTSCNNADPGFYVPEPGATEQLPCPDGTTSGAGATECTAIESGSYCPVDSNVDTLMTDLIGIGQGNKTKGFRTRKLVIPNYQDLDSLYGQLAAVDVGTMKYVRFLPQGEPKVQIHAPTSLAYRPHAVDWWGADLPTDSQWVKGQFFWGSKANKAPRAFVLWPTYDTDEFYANVLVTFDESSENHVAAEPGWIQEQTQIIAIPEVQVDGATVVVRFAIVDNDKDDRKLNTAVTVGSQTQYSSDAVPNRGETLNLYELTFEGVEAGVDEVVIELSSYNYGDGAPPGESAAVIGAAVSYACGEEPQP